MAGNCILLFGDTVDAPIPLIRHLLAKSRNSRNTQLYLQRAAEAVGREIGLLPAPERETIGVVHGIQDLQEWLENKRDPYNVARFVLTFVARIGELILHAEKDPSLLMSSSTWSTVIALSISGSMLAAAAAAVSNDIGDLIETGTYLAVVSCRQAVQIRRRAIELEDGDGYWAFTALGQIVNQLPSILDSFHHDQATPRHRQSYIGVQSTGSWATVFGPPSVLKKLVASSTALKNSNVATVPVLGPVHAPHLRSPDFEWMIGESHVLDKLLKPGYQLVSGSTNRPMAGPKLRNLVQDILDEIFQKSTNPDRVFEAGISLLEKGQDTVLFVLGNTSYLPSIKRTLLKKRVKVVTKSTVSTQENQENQETFAGSEAIAIVGMSGRFPGSETVEELWTSIMERKEFHKKIPLNRWDIDRFDNKSSIFGCFLDHPGVFDHKLFNISPREAIQMDPGQRLLLHTTYEALEDAGVTTNGTRATHSHRVSTFVGQILDDWRELHQSLGTDAQWITGNERAFAAGRLNHYFNWEGASACVDSACASSSTAVLMACKALVNRDCDTAVAGGANIIATPFWHSALTRGGFLSTSGGCKTFREDADGYCRGDAVAVLVLKRLEDALQDNDNIVSVIRGFGRNHSAEATSITHPHAGTQERLYRSVLHKTGLEPDDIGYVEFHGTGTTVGDAIELESISNVFTKATSRQEPLMVGAIKANLGHSEAAAGVISLIKGAMVLKKEAIPAQVGSPKKLGNYPCLKTGQILVPELAIPFSREVTRGKRRILVNNFDAAGGNTCFVLEEAPTKIQTRNLSPRPFHVITVSAHSTVSLEQNKRRMLKFLGGKGAINLANLAYTTTARRNHHALRAAYCGATTKDIADALTKDLSGMGRPPSSSNKNTPIVFVYSGQGGTYAGMGKDLFETSIQFRSIIAELARTCDALRLPSFTSLIADRDAKIESFSVVQQHLSLVVLQIALTKYWEICGIRPDVVLGHSIGEYAALCAAGVLSVFDTLYLVGNRAHLLQAKCIAGTHAMLSISKNASEILSLSSGEDLDCCEIACYNSPGSIVLSGERNRILNLETVLKDRGFKCQLLDIPYAMHSPQMDAISSDFENILDGAQFSKPKVKFVSGLLGYQLAEEFSFGSLYLSRQTREPVKFQQAVASCVSQGLADASSYWLEIGPGAMCLGLVQANLAVTSFHALNSLKKSENNWKSLSVGLAALYMSRKSIDWRAFHSDFADDLSLIDLPKYAFDTRDYWLTYKGHGHAPQTNGLQIDKTTGSRPISTCLHHLLNRKEDGIKPSACFTSTVSHDSLGKIIEGHKLSGISVCPSGVFIDIALTAARYLMTGGDLKVSSPELVVANLQLERPLVPSSDASPKIIQTEITMQNNLQTEYSVLFTDGSRSSRSTLGRCLVRLQDPSAFNSETQRLALSLHPKIASLKAALKNSLADRIRGKLFYKFFSNLMEYGDLYKGVESAIISDDFKEILANVHFPAHDKSKPDQNFTFSPYWADSIAQTLGSLLNGNPNQIGDYIYMGGHMGRLELHARKILPGGRYQIYAHIYYSEKSDFRGNAYILHEGLVVGVLEDMQFHKMPRKILHHLLGKADTLETPDAVQSRGPHISAKTTGPSAVPAASENHQTTNGHVVGLATAFLRILLDETGLLESELNSSTSFSEIGVDSILSISILAALKAETGFELPASFLAEYPTLDDAQRELRIMDNQRSAFQCPNGSTTKPTNGYINERKAPTNAHSTGHTDDDSDEIELQVPSKRSNIVLMQSAPTPSKTPFFLIADGAGSAAAYTNLPQLAKDLQVYALESPWVKDPKNFTCTFSEAAAIYLQAVRSKQPQGPYLLGGWSGGGVFAYEVSRLLLEAGETVLGLIIIDIPAPRDVDRTKVAMPTMEIIEHIGLLAGIERGRNNVSSLSLQMKEHMLSTVKCFSQLDPMPMTYSHHPNSTFVIWAKELIGPRITSMGTESKLDAWFYFSRHGFGPSDWELLVGDEVECFEIPGDHFSIMDVPHVERLGQVLQQVVVKCLDSAT